jgi:hypothetical protein
VFWDTETFVLPFFTFTHPPAARAMLGYRYRTLAAARDNARARGWRGAAYAWESADTGEDVTPAYYVTAAGERKDVRTGSRSTISTPTSAWPPGSTGRPPATRRTCWRRARSCWWSWRGSGRRGPSAAPMAAGTFGG